MSEVKRYYIDAEEVEYVVSQHGQWVLFTDFDAQRLRADTAEAELKELEEAVVWALPGTRFMDPPDGGSPTLGEQVVRMAEALAAAEQRIAEAKAILEIIYDDPEMLCAVTMEVARRTREFLNPNPNPEAESHE